MLILDSHELKIYMDREMREIARIYNIVRLMAIFVAYYYLIKMRAAEISNIIKYSNSIADWIDAAVLIGTFLLELIILFLIHRFIVRPCRLKFMKSIRVPNAFYSYKIVPAKKGECLTVCYKKRGYILYKNFFCIRKKGRYRTKFGLYWFEFANGYHKKENDGLTIEQEVSATVATVKNNKSLKEEGGNDNG